MFSPKKYIKERGRKLPVIKCLISDNYDDLGLTLCLIVRKQPSGKYTFANFMVDRCCLGVKNAFSDCNMDEEEIEYLIDRISENGDVEEVTPEYFHNLIYAAVDFAEENGFKPHKDFKLAEYVLDPDLIDDGIDEIELGGKDGKPLFICGPFDNAERIIATLNKNVGEGNYNFLFEGDDEDEFFDIDL